MILGSIFLPAPPIFAQDSNIQFGIGGTWKLGFPTRIVVQASLPGKFEFATVDGDGIGVQYDVGAGKPISDQNNAIEFLVQNGRSNQQMNLRIYDSDGTFSQDYSIPIDARGSPIPATQTWLVGIGSSLGIDELSSRISGSSLSSFTTSVIENAADLPVHWQAYSGVDLLTISTSDIDLIRGATADQTKAIREWITNGGRAILAVGSNAEAVKNLPWLAELLPGSILSLADSVSGGPIESWIGSSQRLKPLQCARVEPGKSIVKIQLQTATRDPVPFVASRVIGFGQLTFVASDLDRGSLSEWEDRPAFLRRLLPAQWEQWTVTGGPSTTNSSYLGFDDLAGQLRATMDVFPQVQNTGLTFMAMILVLFLLLVGPLDYFVCARFLKKPSWTWWTLILGSIIACTGIAVIARSWKPQLAAFNDCVVWDLDFESKHVVGRSWIHVYSGSQEKYDFRVEPLAFWSAAPKPIPAKLDWMGLPGKGLGGFESSVTADRGMPSYVVSQSVENERTIRGLGIPLAGTKALQANWVVEADIDTSATKLGLVSGSDLLQGEWVNPLPVDLHNSIVLFGNLQYTLPTRVQAGQKVEFSISVIPKDFARQLQRRRIVDGIEKGSPWQPLDRSDLSRLIEILLFHKASGGTGYTFLSHRYLQQLDLSELLRLNRAMVYGRIDQPTTKVDAQVEGKTRELTEVTRQTWIRMVIPVETNSSSITPRG